jgi:hypothetical protein
MTKEAQSMTSETTLRLPHSMRLRAVRSLGKFGVALNDPAIRMPDRQ